MNNGDWKFVLQDQIVGPASPLAKIDRSNNYEDIPKGEFIFSTYRGFRGKFYDYREP